MAGFGSARSSNFPDENQIAGWSAVSFSIPSALSRPGQAESLNCFGVLRRVTGDYGGAADDLSAALAI